MVGTRNRPSFGRLTSKPTSKPAKSANISTNTVSNRTSINNNKTIVSAQTSKITPKAPESRLSERISAVELENAQLKTIIEDLRSELREQSKQILLLQRQSSAQASEISVEQEELNSNIVIRGVEVYSDSSTELLSAVFSGLCSHIGITNVSDFEPELIEVIPPTKNETEKAPRPLKVKFDSADTKRNFLQLRRSKRDIYPGDIGISQKSRRPIRISEHLTKANQELLYQARSLRGNNKYKYIWSNNGQVLARKEDRSRVIRIRDFVHLHELLSGPSGNYNDDASTINFRTGSSRQFGPC